MARERINDMLATEVLVMRSMLAAVLVGKEASSDFQRLIDRLQG